MPTSKSAPSIEARRCKGCRNYFVDAIRMFYSVGELSNALCELGFSDVVGRPVLAGAVGFHAARKAAARAGIA